MRSCVPRGAVIFEAMNPVVIACCVLVALVLLPAQTVRGVLATAAASLFEGAPFILAGAFLQALLARRLGRWSRLAGATIPFFGCGCGGGPSARSLPAAVATALVFGPIPAILRLAAAHLSATLSSRASEVSDRRSNVAGGASTQCLHGEPILSQLAALLPPAVLAGLMIHVFSDVRLDRVSPALQWLDGAIFGFAASPCALGAVALAASLHARAPFAGFGMLCTSGIVDVRAFSHASRRENSHDALAYSLLVAALALVALRNGDALVNPRFVIPLTCCSAASLALAIAHRRHANPAMRVAPALMLAGSLVVAPAPVYTATETTLSNLFPGERVTFTGTLVHGADADALVRFAITCCRADAAPVVIRLRRPLRYGAGTWLCTKGIVARFGGELRLSVTTVRRVAPPVDPFIYR